MATPHEFGEQITEQVGVQEAGAAAVGQQDQGEEAGVRDDAQVGVLTDGGAVVAVTGYAVPVVEGPAKTPAIGGDGPLVGHVGLAVLHGGDRLGRQHGAAACQVHGGQAGHVAAWR